MNKRAIVYIDGYNLYYGLIKGTPYKWLDLWSFSRTLVLSELDLVAVKYFTAPVRTYPYDLVAEDRQKVYLQAIAATGKVEIIHGFYSKSKSLAPCVDPKCAVCDVVKNGFVPIHKLEEKRSDVNLAVSLVSDAALARAECFVVITGDSDQVGAIETVRYLPIRTTFAQLWEGRAPSRPYSCMFCNCFLYPLPLCVFASLR